MNKKFKSQQFQDMLASYEFSEKSGHPYYLDIEDLNDISDYYLANDQPDDAIRVINKGLSIHKDNDQLKIMKAGILVYNHNFYEARKVINEITDCNSNDILYIRAQLAYAIDNDTNKADKLFQKWLEIEEKEISNVYRCEISRNLIKDDYLHVITSFAELSETKDKDILGKWIDKYIERFSPLSDNEYDISIADICRNENMTGHMERVYTLLLESDPYMELGWVMLAMAQSMNGKFEDAINSADFALAINPDDNAALLAKAHGYYSLKDTDSALPLLQKYVDRTNDHQQYLYLGLCYILAEKDKEGYRYIKGAQKQQEKKDAEFETEDDAFVWFEISDAYMTGKFYKEAEYAIDRALAIAPHNANFLLQKGSIQLSTGKTEECLKNFSEAVCVTDNIVHTYLYIGTRFMLIGKDDIAMLMFKAALKETKNPMHMTAHAYIAFLYYQNEQYEKFLEHLKISCEQCPEEAGSLFYEVFPNVKPEEYYNYFITTRKKHPSKTEENKGSADMQM